MRIYFDNLIDRDGNAELVNYVRDLGIQDQPELAELILEMSRDGRLQIHQRAII